MKIIHIIDSLLTGGVNSFVYDLSKAQQENGEDVRIIVVLAEENNADNTPVPNGIRAEYLNAPSKKEAILRYIPQLRQIIKDVSKGEPTVCNLHLKLSVLMGGLASAGLKNVKCVETYHNSYSHYNLEFFLMRPFIKKYITVSKTAQLEMYDRFRAPKNKVVAVPNGIDRKKLREAVKERKIHNYIQVISVGRLAFPKNLFVPVEALSDQCNENVRYEIIGAGPDMARIDEARHGNPFIELRGVLERQNVLEHLSNADLLIMSSLWEGRSILQLEAMAFDLPMIISDVPGLREPFNIAPLEKGEAWRRCAFGYVVQTDNLVAYKEALRDFINNPSLHLRMRNAVRDVSKSNDITHMINEYKQVYCDALYTI